MWFELGGLNIYRYKMNSIYLQGGFGLVFFLCSLAFGDWIIALIGGFVAFIMIRDCIKLKETFYEVKKDRIEMIVQGNLKRAIKWNNFEYVTRSRKNPRWVVVGHMKDQIILKPGLDNFDDLTKAVLAHLKDNKEVYIHDSILKKYS